MSIYNIQKHLMRYYITFAIFMKPLLLYSSRNEFMNVMCIVACIDTPTFEVIIYRMNIICV